MSGNGLLVNRGTCHRDSPTLSSQSLFYKKAHHNRSYSEVVQSPQRALIDPSTPRPFVEMEKIGALLKPYTREDIELISRVANAHLYSYTQSGKTEFEINPNGIELSGGTRAYVSACFSQGKLLSILQTKQSIGRGSFSIVYEAYSLLAIQHLAESVFSKQRYMGEQIGKFVDEFRKKTEQHKERIRKHYSDDYDRFSQMMLDAHTIYSNSPKLIGSHAVVRQELEDDVITRLFLDRYDIDLFDHLAKYGSEGITPKVFFEKALSIIEQLKEIHKQGVLHRDLKPENILVKWKEGAANKEIDRVAIIDLMPYFTDGRKGQLLRIGTPGYMPLDMREGKGDEKVDVYALAGIFTHLSAKFTGVQPPWFFKGKWEEEVSQEMVDECYQPYYSNPLCNLYSRMNNRSPLYRPSLAQVEEELLALKEKCEKEGHALSICSSRTKENIAAKLTFSCNASHLGSVCD